MFTIEREAAEWLGRNLVRRWETTIYCIASGLFLRRKLSNVFHGKIFTNPSEH